ncbi:MAG TPA: DNA repair protein RecN [Gammaproteobacteria bacterium]|nr:DNA repair protein RecN [Gammaproteobacteria bacterium]
MLTHIAIRDFAIIDALELNLTTGMSVLTGETGAGKSILVDALGLVLGDRADAEVIRHGAERAEITAEFDVRALPDTKAWLKHNDLTADDECILRRIIGRDGRSRGQINGRSTPLQLLRELGEQLVDIHGQHEHQSLLRPAAQLALLDGLGNHAALLDVIARLYSDWKAAQERLAELRVAAHDRDQRLELLRHQTSELGALALQPDEIRGLDEEHRRLANSGKLLEGTQAALDALYENEETSAYQTLHQALNTLSNLCELDPRLQEIRAALSSAEVQLADASEALRRYLHNSDMDPQRLEWVENRLGAIHDLARKHHAEPDDLPSLLDKLRIELQSVENAEVTLRELETELASLRNDYSKNASELSRQRLRVAADLGKKVTGVMQELGMPGGRFAIDVANEPALFAANGTDKVEFQVSANKGQPLKTLAKVASGGELSRIALAIQVVAAQASGIPAMIFDEVDAGIGGGVAEIVGRRLRSLGEKRQVLCVTHLPQVASQAHQHFRVTKATRGQSTLTTIEVLDKKSQIEELARMLGGVEITDTTRKHAREMIARAGQSA